MSTTCRLDEKAATLSGKRIVVTGGATGIGFATARLAAERGATVVLMSRNESRLQSAVQAIGDNSSAHVVDVTDADAVAHALDSIGPFDHLISSAAGLLQGPFRELSETAVRSFFEVKFWGQYRTLRTALPHLATDGSAVLVSGFLYRKARPGLSPFAAVNGAIEGLVKALALELAPIRVNAISPGQIDSWGGGGPIDARHPSDAPRCCRSGASGRTDRDARRRPRMRRCS